MVVLELWPGLRLPAPQNRREPVPFAHDIEDTCQPGQVVDGDDTPIAQLGGDAGVAGGVNERHQ
jgi:hypothetical protein